MLVYHPFKIIFIRVQSRFICLCVFTPTNTKTAVFSRNARKNDLLKSLVSDEKKVSHIKHPLKFGYEKSTLEVNSSKVL